MAVYPDLDALGETGELISQRMGDAVLGMEITHDELTLTVVATHIVELVDFLRLDANCRFSTLVDITAVDRPERPARFDLVWHFLSMYRNQRIRLKAAVREDEIVPSLIRIHP